MNHISNGRVGYCRILKTSSDTFEAKCNPSTDSSFKASMINDPNPPEEMQQMLQFYEGIVFWLRFKDDILDYAKNLIVSTMGKLTIDEVPKPITHGLEFNGIDQYLRIGDTPNLAFGDIVQLKYLRAVSFWVYFDEFTNNAKIYDFGNGAGQDSVVLGILGRGNMGTQSDTDTAQCQDESQKHYPLNHQGNNALSNRVRKWLFLPQVQILINMIVLLLKYLVVSWNHFILNLLLNTRLKPQTLYMKFLKIKCVNFIYRLKMQFLLKNGHISQ